jgi:hypothetical protein
VNSAHASILGCFPAQPFDVAHGRRAEEPLVLAGEVRGVAVAHAVAGAGGIPSFAQHELPRLLQPQVLLELQWAQRGKRSEVMVEG